MATGRDGANPEDPTGEPNAEHRWSPPRRSDQAPGEEVVQVNDPYAGDGPPPSDDSAQEGDQHPTGG